MEKKPRAKKQEHDFAVTAFRIVQEATGEAEVPHAQPEPTAEERRAAAAILGRLGGKKGGPARASKLTPEQRREIARGAAQARWSKPSREEQP